LLLRPVLGQDTVTPGYASSPETIQGSRGTGHFFLLLLW